MNRSMLPGRYFKSKAKGRGKKTIDWLKRMRLEMSRYGYRNYDRSQRAVKAAPK